MLVVLELIEAGACRRKQHHIARLRLCVRIGDGAFQRTRSFYLRDPRQLRLDLFRGGTNGDNRFCALSQQRRQHTVISILVFAAKNDVHAALEGLHCFHRGIDVGRL